MTSLNTKTTTVAASALACALLVCALAGCAPKTTATASAAAENTASAPAAPATNTTSLIEGAANDGDVDTYCLSCHLRTDLPGWSKENVDAAMVESMLPTLSDDDVQALADYFAAVEPPAQSADQH